MPFRSWQCTRLLWVTPARLPEYLSNTSFVRQGPWKKGEYHMNGEEEGKRTDGYGEPANKGKSKGRCAVNGARPQIMGEKDSI